MKPLIKVVFLICMTASICSFGQDPSFRQFKSLELYTNPAYAGNHKLTKAVVAYRNQYSSIAANFVTYMAYLDQQIEILNAGLGVMVTKDQIGDLINTTTLSASPSFYFNIDAKSELRMGINLGFATSKIDVNSANFSDQINSDGLSTQSLDFITRSNISYFDFGTGLLYEYDNRISLGISAFHINTPNVSFMNQENTLAPRYSIHGSYKIELQQNKYFLKSLYRILYRRIKRTFNITPSFMVNSQAGITQLDFGSNIYYEPLVLGLWARGVPFSGKNWKTLNKESLSFLIGVRIDDLFTIDYSYDLSISKLTPSTGGTHELVLVYYFPAKITKKTPLMKHKRNHGRNTPSGQNSPFGDM